MSYASIVAEHAAIVPPAFDAWVREFGLQRALAPIVYTVLAWTVWCSPRGASMDARAVAAMDLGLCFFFLDDHPDDGAERLYDDVERLLDGHVPAAGDPPLQHAYHEIFERMAARGLPLDRYREGRRALLRCYRRRRVAATFDAYLALRTTTIYVDQWLDMWEVLGDFYLSAEERRNPLLARARTSMIRWHVYENDLASIERDARAGVPNLVRLHGGALPEAIAEVKALADHEERSFVEACAELRSRPMSQSVLRHLDLLEICHRGGIENYRRQNPARYAAR